MLRQPAVALLPCLLASCVCVGLATGPVFAQADPNAEGGSLGGTFAPAAPARDATQPRQRPAPRMAPRAAPPKPARRSGGGGVAAYDGAWSVSAGGGCASAGTSQVTISRGRVIGQGGVSGRVSPSGAVTTLGSFNGLTIVGQGRISGGMASGVYRQSDGCSGPWSAVRL